MEMYVRHNTPTGGLLEWQVVCFAERECAAQNDLWKLLNEMPIIVPRPNPNLETRPDKLTSNPFGTYILIDCYHLLQRMWPWGNPDMQRRSILW